MVSLEGYHESAPQILKGSCLIKYSCEKGQKYEVNEENFSGEESPFFKRFLTQIANKNNGGLQSLLQASLPYVRKEGVQADNKEWVLFKVVKQDIGIQNLLHRGNQNLLNYESDIAPISSN